MNSSQNEMATTSVKPERLPGIAEIHQPAAMHSRSLTSDAFRRLSRNRAAIIGAVIIILNILLALFAPIIAPKSFDDATLTDSNGTPVWMTRIFPGMKAREEGGYVKINASYLLGADRLGGVAIVGPLISIIVGLVVGLVAGYNGGKTDNILMRFVDIMYAFPTYLLIILLMAVFRAGFSQLQPGTPAYALSKLDAAMGGLLFIFIGIGLTAWMGAARLVRGQVLSVRENEYVLAAHALGAPSARIILRHVLPNIIGPLIITETLAIPGYISYEAFLSFIGLGVNPPTPSWGGMIADGAQVIQTYPNQALFPALALFLLMFAFNFMGDGLRDAFDPTLQGRE
jgi:oligopeptide transport system permease protein